MTAAPPPRPEFFRRLALVAWGVFTLVLTFCVALLAYELLQQGKNPFAVGKVPSPPSPPASTPGTLETKSVRLYFAAPDCCKLAAEERLIPISQYTVENCRAVLKELVAGPGQPLVPIVPDTTEVHALYLLERGELIVDFSIDLLARRRRSASAEALMMFGIVNTLTQPEIQGTGDGPVRSVRFLVEGAPADDSFPDQGHLDLSEPIGPDMGWIAAAQSAPPEGSR